MSKHKFDATGIFATVDQKDTEKYLTYYADGGSFTFGNYPASVGKPAIAALVNGVFDSVASLSHQITDVIEQEHPAIIVTNGIVTYTRKDGVAKSYPFSSTAKLNKEGLIQDYYAYVDNHDLFS
jgi:hypothetical protein